MDGYSVQSESRGAVVVVTVAGRIDSETAPDFDRDLTRILDGNSRLVLDLNGVSFISSAGIREMVKAAQAAERTGGAVKLASVPESVNSLLYTVGLNQKIGVFESVDEAVSSFS